MSSQDDFPPQDKKQQRKIQRQRTLSLGKAIEISLKSIKVRFWRSLITMSGIILAIAFLMSIWTTSDIMNALRNVPEENEDKPKIDLLLQKKGVDTAEEQLRVVVISAPSAAAGELVEEEKSPYVVLLKEYAKQFRVTRVRPTDPKLAERIAEADCVIVDQCLDKIRSGLIIEQLGMFVNDGGAVLFVGNPTLSPNIKIDAAHQDPDKVLAKMLPVQLVGSLKKAGKIKAARAFADIQWDSFPAMPYYAAKAKKAKVLLKTEDGDPLLVLRKMGKGRVMVYLVQDPDMKQHQAWISGGMLLGQSLIQLTRHQRGGVGAKETWLIVLSLLVCVVGIVNSMLMSVSERVREIGTMKCLGALDHFIVKLFLLESSFQGIIGAAVGLIIGFLLSFLKALFGFLYIDPTTEKWNWFAARYFPVMDILQSALLAFLIGSFLSILAAVYPAWNAAKMQPVDAMRVDE